jgi:GNAT superfamily N-acetyltransferase
MLADSLTRRLEALELRFSLAGLEAWNEAHPEAAACALDIAGGKALYFGAGSPLSQALHLGMGGEVTASEIDRMEAFYRLRACGIAISVCPYADPSLLEILGQRGYRISHFEHTLFRELADGVEFTLPPEVRKTTAGDRDTWVRTVLEGFFGSTQDTAMFDLFRVVFSSEGGVPFLAEADGEPAAGGTVLLDGAAALLSGDATRPGYRGRGLQLALIRARLAHAASRGCNLAMACTMPGSGSQRNYERAGFRVAYTKAILRKD